MIVTADSEEVYLAALAGENSVVHAGRLIATDEALVYHSRRKINGRRHLRTGHSAVDCQKRRRASACVSGRRKDDNDG